jgi:hypothetical protein
MPSTNLPSWLVQPLYAPTTRQPLSRMLVSCDDPGPTSGARFGSPGQPLPTRHRPARPNDTRLTWCDHPTQRPSSPVAPAPIAPAPAPVLLPTTHPHDATPLSALPVAPAPLAPAPAPALLPTAHPHDATPLSAHYTQCCALHATQYDPSAPALNPIGRAHAAPCFGTPHLLPPDCPVHPLSATHCRALHATQRSHLIPPHATQRPASVPHGCLWPTQP